MSIIIGIDVGGSTTKIVGYYEDEKLIGRLMVEAADPRTSAFGALGKFIDEYKLDLKKVKQIILTGVGSSLFKGNIYNIPTKHVDEFVAIGLGGLALSKKKEGLIVSMGTGTAYVRADEKSIQHIGGSGVGGGTVAGLCKKLVGASSFERVVQLAEKGNLSKIDLTIGDITTGVIKTLPPETTASNFAKMADAATDSDITLGVLNMVFQTIGMLAVFALRNDHIKDIILTGTLTKVPYAERLFKELKSLYSLNFIIPKNAIYATATGAALSHIHKYKAGKKK